MIFSVCKSCTSLLFYSFWCFKNGIVFLIYFWIVHWYCRNTLDFWYVYFIFCVLILYLSTFWTCLLVLIVHVCAYVCVCVLLYSVPSTNINVFSPFFQIWMLFISFSFLIVLVWGTMLNISDKQGHPFLIPDLQGKVFILSSLSIKLALGFFSLFFCGCTLTGWKSLCVFLVCWVFFFYYYERALDFVKWDDYAFLSFTILTWCIVLLNFHMLNQCFIPGIKLTWSFLHVTRFGLLEFRWGYLNLYSWEVFVCSFLVMSVVGIREILTS